MTRAIDPLMVRCVVCGAEPGEPCQPLALFGQHQPHVPHRWRCRDASRWGREGGGGPPGDEVGPGEVPPGPRKGA